MAPFSRNQRPLRVFRTDSENGTIARRDALAFTIHTVSSCFLPAPGGTSAPLSRRHGRLVMNRLHKTSLISIVIGSMIIGPLVVESSATSIRTAPAHVGLLNKAELSSVSGGIGCGTCRSGCTADQNTCNPTYSGGVETGTTGTKWSPHQECGPGISGCSNKGDVLCNYYFTGDNYCNVITPNPLPGCSPTPPNATCTSSC